MEYIDNRVTLKEFLELNPNIELIKQVMENLGQLVAHIHSIGIIHGDITSTNVFVLENNSKLMIYDFGLCQFSSTDENRAVDLYVFKRSFFATWQNQDEQIKNDQFILFLNIYNSHLDKFIKIYNNQNKKTHTQQVISRFYEVEKRGRKRDMIG